MESHPEDHLADQFGSMSDLDKIEWMIETDGWALEAVTGDHGTDPPTPTYAYSVGFPTQFGFPEVAVFGLAPVAAKGLIGLVADARRGGTEIPLGVELVGLLDNELRCVFAPVDPSVIDGWFPTLAAWHRGADVPVVQLMYPDRNGFLPYEAGFEHRLRFAQPLVGTVTTSGE